VEKWNGLLWPGTQQKLVEQAYRQAVNDNVVDRIWNHDYTLWKDDPTEITNRLGWLHGPRVMQDAIDEINSFVSEIRAEGFSQAVLLGMGGSSLAPEVFRLTFGVAEGFLDLTVLDSTDPDSVLEKERFAEQGKTLFIVSTKSGGTVETMSFMKYFYQKTYQKYGPENVGNYFIAITDPGSGLEKNADELNFRKVFLNDPNIGGRFSALSYFGLVPAALIGVDLKRILDLAEEAVLAAHHLDDHANLIGIILGAMAAAHINKLTMILSPQIISLGAWIEQLIAESTGKESKGILPVDQEELTEPSYYDPDRLFVYIKLNKDDSHDAQVDRLIAANFPVLVIELDDIYEIGAEFFRWEVATALAGYFLKINPYDQPDVESAKKLARAKVADFKKTGKLPQLSNPNVMGELVVYSDYESKSLTEFISKFLNKRQNGSYISVQAYLNASSDVQPELKKLQSKIHQKYKLATTVGIGPRFLHSTGQLHKGDNGLGLFIQIIGRFEQDCQIPDTATSQASSISFGILRNAQSLGDREALLHVGRNVLRLEIGGNLIDGIKMITSVIS